jgi:cation diffusion facilitator CzcD-associated flavoprotein CzcO
MSTDKFNVKPGQHIPGEVVTTYLTTYAKEFGISDLIRLETTVLVAEHQETIEGGWILTVKTPTQKESQKIYTRRLIIATGLISDPFMPHFEGQDTFGGKMFHSKDFPQNINTLKTSKSVTVFGAGKSGWDAVYEYATAGVKVNWVIRGTYRTGRNTKG